MGLSLRFQKTILLSATPEQLWSLIAQTDRVNRVVGLPAVQFVKHPMKEGSSVLRAESKKFGLKLIWDEFPFEWVENRYFHVTRKFPQGPIDEIHTGVHMRPHNSKTQLDIFANITPRNFIGAAAAKLFIGRKALSDMERLAHRFEQFLEGGLTQPFERSSGKAVADLTQLNALAAELKSIWSGDPCLVDRLTEHLREAFDEEVVGMRPFELADRWDAERLDVLKLFLHATKAGILDLNWAVLCPTCRVVKAKYGTLRELKNTVHCDTCQIEYGADFDQNVELKFNVNGQIRRAQQLTYCVGGPGNTPHRIAQFYLAPGDVREERVHLRIDRLRFRSYEVSPPAEIRVRESANDTQLKLVCTREGFQPAEMSVAPGEDTITLENRTEWFVLAILEAEEWREKGATASLVTSLQEFRDMFSSEVLAPGDEVGIRSLTFLFTDLKSSTDLYETIGDAPAYGLVRSHFEFLKERIAACNGSIVKTIGDAVMAVFLSGKDAVDCALNIQRDVVEFNRSARNPITIKMGLHQGPVVAVNANDKLDYFGTTVNVASRVQDESTGGDIVLTQPLYGSANVETAATAHRLHVETFEVKLKGLSDHFVLRRLLYPDQTS